MLAIIGAGGFARELEKAVCGLAAKLDDIEDVVYVVEDRFHSSGNSAIHGLNVVPMSALVSHAKRGGRIHYVVAVADSRVRERLAKLCDANGMTPIARVCGLDVEVGPGVRIVSGAVLCSHTVLTADLVIGKHFHANLYSYVTHDCHVGDFVTLAPRASVNGNCVLGDHVYVGTGAVVLPGVTIGEGAVIGAGAVVTKNVPAGETWAGVPAKCVKGTGPHKQRNNPSD